MGAPVYIVEAARTPLGRFKGSLSGVRADELGAVVLSAVCDRAGLDPAMVDDVVFGCVTQIGEQCGNVARTSLLQAGFPEHVPGMTVDRKCGSGEVAVQVAAASIASGTADIVIAGGVENMTRVPMGSNREIHGEAFGPKLLERFELVAQGEASERIAERWNLTRADMDGFSAESQKRAKYAQDNGYFDREIVPLDLSHWSDHDGDRETTFARDETIRHDTTLEKLAALKPSFRVDGRSTAGNSSQRSDGAAALMLASEAAVEKFGLRPRARITGYTAIGSDPTLMLTGPIAATRRILERTGLSLADIAIFEVNEAFSSVPLAWLRETGVPREKLNVNGGAIALGHPLGASGARVMTSLLHEMERRGARYGLQSFCCAGGLGTATVLERL